MQIKKFFLYIAPIIMLMSYVGQINAEATNFEPSATPGMPYDGAMPSVEELFGSMTEEEIVQQIQEAKKLFESLSPEELEEFSKIMDATWSNMTDSDKNTIQDIATMVKNSPFLPEDDHEIFKEEPKEKAAEAAKNIVKEESSDTIQALIDNLIGQIDDVSLKINSNKDLVQEFTSNWSNKVTFDKLKRQILALKEDRLAKKLSEKKGVEDKELYTALETFYKKLKTQNKDFYVEDTFGLPSSSNKQSEAQLKQTKKVLNVFDDAIKDVMPKVEAFLKAHDPEALEMAKESAERAKRASEQAKDASEKRNMTPATPAPEPTKKSTTPSSAGTVPTGNYPGYYDYYQPYGNWSGDYGNYSYPDMGHAYGTSAHNADAPKKDAAKKEEPKKAVDKKEGKSDDKKDDKVKAYSAFDTVQDALDDYFDDYSKKDHGALVTFLEKDLSRYPTADNARAYIANPDLQGDWINGKGYWEKEGFMPYMNNVSEGILKFKSSLHAMGTICNRIGDKIHLMGDAELKKIAESKEIKMMLERIKEYKEAFNNAYAKIKKQAASNLDTTKTFLSGDANGGALDTYRTLHQRLEDKLSSLREELATTEKEIQKIYTKIKRQQGKNKRAAEKARKA